MASEVIFEASLTCVVRLSNPNVSTDSTKLISGACLTLFVPVPCVAAVEPKAPLVIPLKVLFASSLLVYVKNSVPIIIVPLSAKEEVSFIVILGIADVTVIAVVKFAEDAAALSVLSTSRVTPVKDVSVFPV